MVQFAVEKVNGKLPEKVRVSVPPKVEGLESTKALVEVTDDTVVLVCIPVPVTVRPT